MRALAVLAVLTFTGCATLRHRADMEGSGGGFTALPPLQLEVFGQGIAPTCAAGGACLVGSLSSSGAISGTTLTTTGNITGLDILGRTFQSSVTTGFNAFAATTNGSRFDYGAGSTDYASSDGTTVTFAGPTAMASALNVGVKVLAAGTGAVTVTSGAKCNCSLNTSAGTAAPKCSVSSTTLTITGTGTDSINYSCF